MYEASFYRIILNLIRTMKKFKVNSLNELASTINQVIKNTIEAEKVIERKKDDTNYVLNKIIKSHDEIEITIMEIEMLLLILDTIKNIENFNEYDHLNNHYLLLTVTLINVMERLQSYKMVRISK